MWPIFDPLYLAILIVGGLISLVAAGMVKLRFAQAKAVPLRSGKTGAQVAQQILDASEIYDVQIVESHGFLSDHYNPSKKHLALSPDVYHGTSAAAAGVAAHEVGHAIQHAQGSIMMWARSMIVPAANLGSMLGPYVVLLGIFMMSAGNQIFGEQVAIAGIILFGMATLFTFITVPVEFDASAKAKALLQTLNITASREEDAAVRSVLTAAGLTYVAAAIVSLMQLLYWAYRAGLIGNRRN